MEIIKYITNYSINQRNVQNLLLFVNYILFCTFPLISCAIADNGNSLDASSEHRKQWILPIEDESFNDELNSDEDLYKSDEELDEHPQRYAAYHESYITEDAAKKLRHKMSSKHEIPYTQKDYEDLLQDILLEPIDKPNGGDAIYDKKYFDYLPAEGVNTNAANEQQQQHVEYTRFQPIEVGGIDDEAAGGGGGGGENRADRNDDGGENNDDNAADKNSWGAIGENIRNLDGAILDDNNGMSDDGDIVEDYYITEGDDEGGNKNDEPLPEVNTKKENRRRKRDIFNDAVGSAFLIESERRRTGAMPLSVLNANIMYKWHNQLINGLPRIDRFYLPVPIPNIIQVPGNYHNIGQPPDNPAGPKMPPIADIENRFGEDDGQTSPPLIHKVNNVNDPVLPWERPNRVETVFQTSLPQPKPQAAPQTALQRPPEPLFVYPEDDQISRFPPRRPIIQNTFNTAQNRPAIVFGDSGDRRQPIDRAPTNDILDFENSPIWKTDFGQNSGTTRPPSTFAWQIPSSSRQQTTKTNRFLTTTRQMARPTNSPLPPPSSSPTRRPSASIRTTQRPEPSRCVWAIVSCCQRGNAANRNKCFELVGCHGSFWDLNPCADDAYAAALAETDKFYNKK